MRSSYQSGFRKPMAMFQDTPQNYVSLTNQTSSLAAHGVHVLTIKGRGLRTGKVVMAFLCHDASDWVFWFVEQRCRSSSALSECQHYISSHAR
ncbi:predicted protein [Plenodomus lingam JN3]|uniref:Predicted protein n=1 Tax=Leptosphaeria maculans (strain JN3 / isolate v23.1.3 / race Av1-4-5-6-7-8) TaxID=985895 RepID=E4ZNF0_LEPMJ|nr:predicted protein [Plenodomus lingam JN3]CBX93009.1 predicted protein [Plenodomus lingam JN3]